MGEEEKLGCSVKECTSGVDSFMGVNNKPEHLYERLWESGVNKRPSEQGC
jgi:hypothetical protein